MPNGPGKVFTWPPNCPLWQCKSLDEAKRIFADQQKRLGVDYFDFYLMHSLHKARYDEAKALGIVDWLWEQKAAGTIRSLGFSCHDHSAGFEHILRDQPWDFCQLQYNYLDTDDRAEEISGDRGYQLTEELGVPLMPERMTWTFWWLPTQRRAQEEALASGRRALRGASASGGRVARVPPLMGSMMMRGTPSSSVSW